MYTLKCISVGRMSFRGVTTVVAIPTPTPDVLKTDNIDAIEFYKAKGFQSIKSGQLLLKCYLHCSPLVDVCLLLQKKVLK